MPLGQKKKRIEDLALISFVKTLRCVSCGRDGGDAHHMTTVKAGGDDVVDNLMPLCRGCHSMVHQVGYGRAIEQRPGIKMWLELADRQDILLRVARLSPGGQAD